MLTIREKAAKDVDASPRLSRIKHIDSTTPSDRYLKILQVLRRNQSAVLTQLWMGHVPLAYHLHRIQAIDTGTCSGCKWANETVIHYLLRCPAHEGARQKLINALGPSRRDLGYLLSHPKVIPHTLRFIDDTGRLLSNYRHVITTADQNKRLQQMIQPAKRTAKHKGGDNAGNREQTS